MLLSAMELFIAIPLSVLAFGRNDPTANERRSAGGRAWTGLRTASWCGTLLLRWLGRLASCGTLSAHIVCGIDSLCDCEAERAEIQPRQPRGAD